MAVNIVDLAIGSTVHYQPKHYLNSPIINYLGEEELIDKVTKLYKEYKNLKNEMDDALNEVYNPDDIEFYNYEIDEIDKANLIVGEDEIIALKEKEYLSISKNLEKLNTAIGIFEGGFQDDFFEINKLTQSFEIDIIENANTVIKSAYYDVDEAINSIRNYVDKLDISEQDINELQERSFEINRLKRKYGGSIESILKYEEELLHKIEIINNRQEYLDNMNIKVNKALVNFKREANKLSDIRIKKSKLLDKEIEQILKDLMLPNAIFKTNITTDALNKNGINDIEFLISMNKGEELKPLSKVASGGELSRLMLGLKVIFSKLQGISTIIFDEIDTGVSGPVATSIGKKMKDLSNNAQVFSISHLAQVAACANSHYHVSKSSDDSKTSTQIVLLDENTRIKELAILSSGEATDISLEAAKELYRKNQGN